MSLPPADFFFFFFEKFSKKGFKLLSERALGGEKGITLSVA